MNKLHAYPNNNLSNYWSLYAGTEIPANADMHDYMTPGNYYHPKSSTAKTLVNCPLTDAFQLKVTAPIENSTGGYLLQEYTAFDGKSVVKVHYDSYLQEWVEPVVYVTKDDLTKSIDFRGNAKTFKVRSGTDGLKNIYLDIEDGSGNTCSLAFLSDGENAVKLMLNGKTVWTK